MLWYLANGSLNEFLKSQIQLQGQYYTKQPTALALVDFSANEGVGTFTDITLQNMAGYSEKYLMTIDEVKVELALIDPAQSTISTSPFKNAPTVNKNNVIVTNIKQLSINKLIINSEVLSGEIKANKQSNIQIITAQIKEQLAQDYPKLYPEISAQRYAQEHPELDALAYAKSHPQAGPIIEHKQGGKKRGKPQNQLKIQAININTLELSNIENGVKQTKTFNNLQLSPLGDEQGLIANQLGGELLLTLLALPTQNIR